MMPTDLSQLKAFRRDLDRFEAALEEELRAGTRGIFTRLGETATTQHMADAGKGAGERSRGDDGPLRIVRGRLARSLTGGRGMAGAGSEAIREVHATSRGVEGTWGSKVPYAAIHEYGGQIKITEKMRGYFWYKHAETKEEKWRAMALSETLTMPERSYARTALADDLDWIMRRAEESVLLAARRSVLGKTGDAFAGEVALR